MFIEFGNLMVKCMYPHVKANTHKLSIVLCQSASLVSASHTDFLCQYYFPSVDVVLLLPRLIILREEVPKKKNKLKCLSIIKAINMLQGKC